MSVFARPAAAAGDERARLAMAVATSPNDPALRRALAVALVKAGEAKAGFDQFRALIAMRPNDPDAAADAGLAARKCAREEEALPLVKAAAEANPGHARLWQVLGLIHRALDDLDPATAALERAARLAPGDRLIGHSWARSLFEAGKPAVSAFRQASRLAPADPDVTIGLVAALLAEGRADEATAELEARLAREPGWVGGHAVLARHLWSMGEREGFTRSLERALEAMPGNVALWKELIIALIHAERYDEALAAIARGRARAGPDLAFDANEASCHAELGDFARADVMFAALAGLNDSTVVIRHIRHLLRTGRPAQAERIALPMARAPGGNIFWPYVALAWRMTGDPRWRWLEGDERLVGVYDLGAALPSLDALADCLRLLHNTVHQPLEQSLRGGTQTDGYLLSRVEPEIRALRRALVEAVETHVAQLPPADPGHPQLSTPRRPIRFSGAWSVRLTSGGCHANHIHPAGWFSSAFYVALPDPEARGPAPAGWLTLGEPQAQLRLDLEPFRTVEPKPGRLVLFPSTMWHGTRPFAEGERLTVAFDVAPPPA